MLNSVNNLISQHLFKMENIKKVPVLRFPKFSEEWEVKKLNDIADLTSSKRVYLSDYVNEGIPFYRGKEISELKRNEKPKDILYITREAYETFKTGFGVPQVNDILITAVGTLGNVYRIKNDSEFYFKDGNLIWLKNVKIFSAFLEILLEINHEAIQKSSIGSTQRALTIIELKKLKFNIPILLEQQKIADFLSQIDSKIEQLTKKKQLLESYKKGAMQKIFSQELRFKDDNGDDYSDWKEKKLGELCKITTGKLDANAMVENGEYRFYTCAKDYFKIDVYAFDTEALLISGNGANVGYVHYYKGKFNAYQRTYVLDKFKEKIIYIKYFLDKNLSARIDTEKKEGNTPYIVMATLSEMNIKIPSLEEQTKIANFLTEIDKKINLTEKQLNGTKQYKKGLLQQMFI